MTPLADSPVRWHPAPSSGAPPREAMQVEPAAARNPRPDLAGLRQSLEASRQEAGAMRERRARAGEAAVRLTHNGFTAEGCFGVAAIGIGYLVTASICAMPLGWRIVSYLGGACCSAGGLGLGCCCLACRRSDQRDVADNPTAQALDAAEAEVRTRETALGVAEAVEILEGLGRVAGPDCVNLTLEYARPLPPGDGAPAPPR